MKPQKSGEFLPLSENLKTQVFIKESEMTPFIFLGSSYEVLSHKGLFYIFFEAV